MDFNSLHKNIIEDLDIQKQEWLKQSMEKISLSKDAKEEYFFKSAMAKRKVGISKLNTIDFQMDEAVRILLLLHTLKYLENSSIFIKEAYSIADTSERVAIIKALSLLVENSVDKDEIKEIALLAKQATNEELFCALALHNSYGAKYLSEEEFNNMVLKALHLDLNLEYLIGLEDRNNASLQTLIKELVIERKSANRASPLSIDLIYKKEDKGEDEI